MGNTKCLKYRPSEEKKWSVKFIHPLRLNSNGEKGRWTRRSLMTIDSKIADNYVNEMKDLLSHEDLWEGENGKLQAEKKYSPVVTSAFYDSILPEEFKDNESIPIRENLLPLPSSDDGYNKVLFVGTTGAGKSTLLRQLIGTTSENFPLTTTGKATVSDLEVIVAEENYKSVVTFFTRRMTETFIQECVYNALLKAMNESDKNRLSQNYSGFYIWVKIATFIFFHDIYYIKSILYKKFDFSVSYVQKIRSKAAILTSTQFGGVCF